MNSEFSSLAARVRACIARQPAPSDDLFECLALELFALQWRHVAPYHRLCGVRGVCPEDVHSWPEIPAVPASAFKEFELSGVTPEERTRCFCSSGTTSQTPGRHYHSAESLSLYEISLLAWWKRNLVTLGGDNSGLGKVRLLMLTPPPATAPHSSLVHMFETLRREVGSDDSIFAGGVDEEGAWVVDGEVAIRAMHASRNGPLIVLGTAFSFVHLLDSMVERGIRLRLPPGSRVMETGGYKGRSREMPKAGLHQLITDRLGVADSHIFCEYGMSELSSQAYDVSFRNADFGMRIGQGEGRNPGRVFRFPPWVRLRIVSPETGHEVGEGEVGLIRVFDLANVWSVMAIQTEDLGVRREDGFELVGRARLAEARGCSLMAV